MSEPPHVESMFDLMAWAGVFFAGFLLGHTGLLLREEQRARARATAEEARARAARCQQADARLECEARKLKLAEDWLKAHEERVKALENDMQRVAKKAGVHTRQLESRHRDSCSVQ